MAKYDGLRGQELLEVEEPDKEGGITLIFKDNRFIVTNSFMNKINCLIDFVNVRCIKIFCWYMQILCIFYPRFRQCIFGHCNNRFNALIENPIYFIDSCRHSTTS